MHVDDDTLLTGGNYIGMTPAYSIFCATILNKSVSSFLPATTTRLPSPSTSGSTYLCQSAFSHMKISKSKYHSTMTNGNLEVCLRLAPSSYCPDYENLADFIQCKSSEYVLSTYNNKYMSSII